MPTEADTCRTLITPELQAAGWETDPHSIAEQCSFTDGRIVVHGSTATHLPPAQLAADILKKEQRIGEIMGNIHKLLGKAAS